MTIIRKPVITGTRESPIIHALPCIGCGPQRAAHLAANPTGDASFNCPNLRSGDPTKCGKTCFLYPRKVRGGEWHFHQGIDVGGTEGVSEIRSVTDGVVHYARNEPNADPYSGYGKVVVIKSEPFAPGEFFYYLYAHCDSVSVSEGDVIRQQQVIAKVGRTQYFRGGPDHTDTMGPHLHFEVATRPYWNSRNRVGMAETTLDNPRGGARIDPLEHLERLGPWGDKKLYFPLVSGGGDETANEISVEAAQRLYEASERDNVGGYFPLGANNIWHGGVHLRAEGNAVVRAPFDAKIVAVRLDPDPVRARGPFGSLNFVLLHHELPDPIVEQLRGSRPPARESWRGAVGQYRGRARRRREVPNTPEHVREIKQLLHEINLYSPDPPELVDDGATVDPAFLEAILRFQSDFSRNPDGVIDIPGSSYHRLQERVELQRREREVAAAVGRGEPAPRPKTVYSLLMHLQPEPLEDALVSRIPWLGRVQLEPTEAERAQEEAERAQRAARREAEIIADGADRHYHLAGDVGPPRRTRGPANNTTDLAWVQRRLTRHGMFSGAADGQWSAELEQAIQQFQREHVRWYQSHRPDARISAGGRTGSTEDTLRMTPAEIEASEDDPAAAREGSLDRRFVNRVTERHSDTGVARVLTGLDIPINAGEVVWTAGVGIGFAEVDGDAEACGIAVRGADASATQPSIHWEIFTEEALIGEWQQVDDDRDDDLAVDVPSLINTAQGDADAAAEPFDEAYDDPAHAPAEDGGTAAEADEDSTLTEDDVLSVAEIRAFFASERSRFLRRTQVRFHSEWALNLSNTVDALRELGWNTRCLESSLAPYMWWSEADDAVPASKLVWHYNPIAFMERYWQLLPRRAEPAATSSTSSTSSEAEAAPAELCDVDPERQICE